MNKKVHKKSEAVCKRLVLTGHWFNEIKSGRKKVEFRDGTKRYDAMFMTNPPDEIEFSLGYTNDPKKLMRFKVKGIHRVLTIPGYVIARRTGRCMVDSTFRASMGTDEQLKRFAKWLPETDDSLMLGDNQAGVYAAQKLKPGAAVINLGTSGQLSRVGDEGRGKREEEPQDALFRRIQQAAVPWPCTRPHS
mgnify:CR=1 FL=1